jgi:hypothetical protein
MKDHMKIAVKCDYGERSIKTTASGKDATNDTEQSLQKQSHAEPSGSPWPHDLSLEEYHLRMMLVEQQSKWRLMMALRESREISRCR